MRARLSGQTALVTGSARRIGRVIALALAREGVHVVVHYNTSAEAAEATAEEIRSTGVSAWTVQADLASPSQPERLFARAAELAGSIDILVNNASVFPESRLEDVTAEELARNVNLHAFAPLALGRALAARRRGGSIVNLLDARIVDCDAAHVAYHLSKRMLYALTRMMALRFAPDVRVNAVAPGLILPPAGSDESRLHRLAETNPLRRWGEPEDVAAAVVFLLRSGFITGQVIFVDGGRHMKGRVYG